jgi:ADP-heptose:LPS heptosyltransferase
LRELRLFVSNDSGPAHLATALNVPAVIVFGAFHPAAWAPIHRIWQRPVADLSAPCRLIGVPCGCPDDSSAKCLSGVTVDAVLDQARALLALVAKEGRPSRMASERAVGL